MLWIAAVAGCDDVPCPQGRIDDGHQCVLPPAAGSGNASGSISSLPGQPNGTGTPGTGVKDAGERGASSGGGGVFSPGVANLSGSAATPSSPCSDDQLACNDTCV